MDDVERLIIVCSEDQDLIGELTRGLTSLPEIAELPNLANGRTGRGELFFPAPIPEHIGMVVLALGSAGAFTAFYQLLATLLRRHSDHEITLQRGDAKIVIKGHSLPEERMPIRELFPDLDKGSELSD